MNGFLLALYLQIPVVIGGVLHMVVVTHGLWPSLARPVNQPLFGANKTWRGFVVVPLATLAGAIALSPAELALGANAAFGSLAELWLAGLCAGFGYVLAELPNSWWKRRLGIAPGATPERHRRFFIALDQVDSGIGVALVYALWPGIPLSTCVFYVLSFPFTALLVKQGLYHARLKKSAV